MRHALTLAILLTGLTQAATAADKAPFEWNKERFDLVAAGDAEQGKQLAKKFKCERCHNADGISDDEETPSIAGQRATYMYKQMYDFKNGFRENREMKKATRKMSDDQMAHVSVWYAGLERPPMAGGEAPLQVKICDSCHDKDIVEQDDHIEVAPVLNGQVRQYLEASMMAFKDADRSNDLFERMQSVSHSLTDDEIKRLTTYYAAEGLTE